MRENKDGLNNQQKSSNQHEQRKQQKYNQGIFEIHLNSFESTWIYVNLFD